MIGGIHVIDMNARMAPTELRLIGIAAALMMAACSSEDAGPALGQIAAGGTSGGSSGSAGAAATGGATGSGGGVGSGGSAATGGSGGTSAFGGSSSGSGGTSGTDAGADAASGGSSGAPPCPFNTGSGGACSGVSIALEATATACVFGLPAQVFGQSIDPRFFNVTVLGSSGQVLLGLVCSASDCANYSLGYYFDDNATPTQVVLCPDTCAGLGAADNLDALLGCATAMASPKPDAGDGG